MIEHLAAQAREADRRPTAAQREDGHRELPLSQVALAVGLAVAMTVLSAVGYGAVATLLGYAAVAIAAAAPPVGLALLILVVPLREPAGFGPLGFDLVLGIGILLGCLAGLPRGRFEIRVSLLWAVLIAFGIVAAIQVLATPPDFLGEQILYATLQLAAVAGGGAILLAAQHLLRTHDWGPYLDLVVVSGVVVTGLAIASIATNGAIRGTFPSLFGIGIEQDRAVGPFNNTNYFGLFGVMALLVALYRASTGAPWRRALTLAGAALITVGVVLSFSRGALLAAAVGFIVLGFSRGTKLGVAALLLCVIGAFASYQTFSEARFGVTSPRISTEAAFASQAASDASRLAATNAGFELFARDPVFGVGFGQYHFVSPLYLAGNPTSYSHNWYMDVLAEQGLLGISLMTLAAGLVLASLRRSEPSRRGLALAVLAAYGVGCAFTEAPGSLQISGIAWLVVGGALASMNTVSIGKRLPKAGFAVARPDALGRPS
jgi:hypothetical protein